MQLKEKLISFRTTFFSIAGRRSLDRRKNGENAFMKHANWLNYNQNNSIDTRIDVPEVTLYEVTETTIRPHCLP